MQSEIKKPENRRYVWLIRPNIPSKTVAVASLHMVGHGCRVPLLIQIQVEKEGPHAIEAKPEWKFHIFSDVPHTHMHLHTATSTQKHAYTQKLIHRRAFTRSYTKKR